jgi:hypothetical protein
LNLPKYPKYEEIKVERDNKGRNYVEIGGNKYYEYNRGCTS